MKRACVIGAGLGGLALAIRLQAAGIATTLVEARDQPGGRASTRLQDGFAFDLEPGVVTAPAALAELWQLSGHDFAADVELLPIAPFYRLSWPEGLSFDLSGDDSAVRRQIARIAPADIPGYEELLAYSQAAYREGYVERSAVPFLKRADAARSIFPLLRLQPWRSIHAMVASTIRDEHLRQAFSFRTLQIGGNPLSTSALYALTDHLEREGGVWWARGGTSRLAAAMAAQFERIGGKLVLHDPVTRIHVLGDQATEIETQGGRREGFDAVASNADVVHTYRQLLGDTSRGRARANRLTGKRWSPSLFVVHLGLTGSLPTVPHRSVLFGLRYEGWLRDVYEFGVLPEDFLMFLHHPSATDPSIAPPGQSVLQAVVPVAHRGKLPLDWEQVGPLLERRVIDEIGRRLVPDIHERIVTRFHVTPRDLAIQFSAYHGSANSLEPVLSQSGPQRCHNRDPYFRNLYLVGAGTHPGAGIPGVIAGAKATAGLMLEDLA